jgi:hypothetical protein
VPRCFAHALLTRVAISREGAQGKHKPTAWLSTAYLQNEGRIIKEDMTDYLNQFSNGTRIVKQRELERLLIAA